MFSGELMTSLGDSWYLEVLFDCYDQYLYESLPKKEQRRFRHEWRRFKDYGDDGVLSYPKWLLPHICPDGKTPTHLRDYLLHVWGMELKMSDTFISFDEEYDNEGLFTVLTEENPIKEIVRRGPKFLKRYLISGDSFYLDEPLPWRQTSDYFGKATTVAGKNQSVLLHLVRLRALALDTYGTNPRAYSFLRTAHDKLFHAAAHSFGGISRVEALISGIIQDVRLGDVSEWELEDRNLFTRLGGISGLHLMQLKFPDRWEILEEVKINELEDQAVRDSAISRRHQGPFELMGIAQ
jgi:hypothetical protein